MILSSGKDEKRRHIRPMPSTNPELLQSNLRSKTEVLKTTKRLDFQIPRTGTGYGGVYQCQITFTNKVVTITNNAPPADRYGETIRDFLHDYMLLHLSDSPTLAVASRWRQSPSETSIWLQPENMTTAREECAAPVSMNGIVKHILNAMVVFSTNATELADKATEKLNDIENRKAS
ncbi:hypothetical protein FWC63_01075 [Candidatus Saccharibacteria bacterium]|nr:hypothetical protein [Candidatus Saccharibacteria bacterium]